MTVNPIGGGWTCPACNAWVAAGTYHYCPSQYQQPTQTYTYTVDYSIVLGRIATALERVAVALESEQPEPLKDDG